MLSGRLAGAPRRQGGPAEARQGRSELELLVKRTSDTADAKGTPRLAEELTMTR